jgi:RNA polymerase sigma-70 factor, ECF subfamily
MNRNSDIFETHRARLWGIAYRMLGSRAEADDMVQEAWLRWDRSTQAEIRAPEAWLVTATTRLCIDRLRQLRTERRSYVGPWLPEPLAVETAPPADHSSELASDLSVAFLAVLERLAPEERAAFLLHEMFDSGYGEIAQILGKSEAACRQLVSRARKRVREDKPRVHVNPAVRAQLLQQLAAAVQAQDPRVLLVVLTKDATWTSDGGGKTKAAKKIVSGAERVARFALGVFRRHLSRMRFVPVNVNDEAGLAVFFDDLLLSVITIRTDGHKILGVYSILNPDKIRGLEVGVGTVTTGPAASSGM